VYGDTVEGDISELSTTNPTDLLGYSKLELEDRLLSLATNDFQVLVVRLSNSFGVAANPLHTPWDLLINDLCMEAISKGTMSIRTNGRQFRDFVPLGEVVRAIRSLLHHEMTASGVFLLASGVTRTVSQTATLLADSLSPHLGFRPEISLNETDLQQYRPFRFDTRKLSSMGISIQNDWTSEVKLLVEAVRQTNRTVSR
jgi:UDP-glucose 4-epimerase